MLENKNDIYDLVNKANLNYRQIATNDINQALKNPLCNLCLKFSNYYFNDGTEQELLYLTGTIRIHYKGVYYHIPTKIWINSDYPQSKPICYIKPTSDMCIDKSNNLIRSDGSILNVSYLDNWKSNDDQINRNLSDLITELSNVFSRKPPVYSNYNTSTTIIKNNAKDIQCSNSLPYPLADYGMPQPQKYTSLNHNYTISPSSLNTEKFKLLQSNTQKVSRADSKDDSSKDKCIICMDSSIDCVLIECGHMISCLKCSKSFHSCPVCRRQIVKVIKVYKS